MMIAVWSPAGVDSLSSIQKNFTLIAKRTEKTVKIKERSIRSIIDIIDNEQSVRNIIDVEQSATCGCGPLEHGQHELVRGTGGDRVEDRGRIGIRRKDKTRQDKTERNNEKEGSK